MESPRKFEEPVTGEELFGNRLPYEDLANAEVYPGAHAEVVEMHRWAGELVDGGPPVDADRIRSLRSEQDHSETAREELAKLMRYTQWYRTAYALSMQDNEAS